MAHMENNHHHLQIGGSKGHVEETIDGDLLKLYRAYRWKMIPQCTGRYTCRDHEAVSCKTPIEVLHYAGIQPPQDSATSASCSQKWRLYEYSTPGKDRILIIPLDLKHSIGLITYMRPEVQNTLEKGNHTIRTSYVHTLNSASGFRRKLQAVGISFTNQDTVELPCTFHE